MILAAGSASVFPPWKKRANTAQCGARHMPVAKADSAPWDLAKTNRVIIDPS
ncbi:MAG: hypothetical protein JWM83_875 [Candidatus Angelobacter sp.]|nr:hypothetical protein [Candidatus Angelobacter sp.]